MTDKDRLEHFRGYLYAKLDAIGSKSEGPSYFVQLIEPEVDGKEIPVTKKVERWVADPALHGALGQKVTLRGARSQAGSIDYVAVLTSEEPLVLDLTLDLKEDTLWIDHMPGPPPAFPPTLERIGLTLSVEWPFRSIWEGQCPTSQLFELTIEDPAGETIWRWGAGMSFTRRPTRVEIPGGSPKVVELPWCYFADAFVEAGLYVATATFIASEQTVRRPFRVKFAQ